MDNYKTLPSEKKSRFWQEHITAWQQSDQSQKEYCRIQKLKISTFGYWRTRLCREKGFIEIPIKIESQATIDIVIKDDMKIRVKTGFDPNLLIQTIRVLEQIS